MSKKVIFNKGGMPLYLDDLKAIQDQIQEMGRFIGRTYGASILAVDFGLTPYINGEEHSYRHPACTFLVDGEVYTMEAKENISPDTQGKFYVHLIRTESESRIFTSGDNHNCHETLTAEIVTHDSVMTKPGNYDDDTLEGYGYYNVNNVVVLSEGKIVE